MRDAPNLVRHAPNRFPRERVRTIVNPKGAR